MLDAGNTPRVRTFTNHVRPPTFTTTKTGLYTGTHLAHLYVSTDWGETWTELDGFQGLPSRATLREGRKTLGSVPAGIRSLAVC